MCSYNVYRSAPDDLGKSFLLSSEVELSPIFPTMIVITVHLYLRSCLCLKTVKEPFGPQVKLPICVSVTHARGVTLSQVCFFYGKRHAGKLNTNFSSRWFDPFGNGTQVYHFR